MHAQIANKPLSYTSIKADKFETLRPESTNSESNSAVTRDHINNSQLNSQNPVSSTEDLDETFRLQFFSANYAPQFAHLTWNGDTRLLSLTKTLLAELYGQQNRSVLKQICDDWVSNENWYTLALVYRLDQFTGWKVPITGMQAAFNKDDKSATSDGKAGTGSGNNRDKGRGGTTGLWGSKSEFCGFDCRPGRLRQLYKSSRPVFRVAKAWGDLWEAYWMCILSERDLWSQSIADIKVFFHRFFILKYGLPSVVNRGVMDMGPSGLMLGPVEDVERERVEFMEWMGVAGMLLLLKTLIVAEREMSTLAPIPSDEDEMMLRQEMFDILAAEWLGKPVPLNEQDIDAAVKRIQSLRRKLFPAVSVSRYSNKALAQTYWFEVLLTNTCPFLYSPSRLPGAFTNCILGRFKLPPSSSFLNHRLFPLRHDLLYFKSL